MSLHDIARELETNIYDWRFRDLTSISNALDGALSSVKKIKDKETAEDFSRSFEKVEKLVEDLNEEVQKLSKKAEVVASMAEKEETSAKKE
jgi:hypothetical protein